MARRYEFRVLVSRTIFHEWEQRTARTSEILFLPREHKFHIFELTRRSWWFSEDLRLLSEHFRRFSKIIPKARWTLPNIFREFPNVSEDVQRLPNTFEEDPKMFRLYTNEFKYNLRDKLDISEIIDILTSEDIISSYLRISYRFYQFVTTRYTTNFYILRLGFFIRSLWKSVSYTLVDVCVGTDGQSEITLKSSRF